MASTTNNNCFYFVLLFCVIFILQIQLSKTREYDDKKWDAFKYDFCENNNKFENFNEFDKLQKNFNNFKPYGPYKDKFFQMFKNNDNSPYNDFSMLNDGGIYDSLMTLNSIEFSKNQDRTKHHNLIHATTEAITHSERKRPSQQLFNINNVSSLKSYFLFTVTKEVETIYNKLKNVDPKNNFNGALSKIEYQILRTNLVYVGSGNSARPFKHVISVNNVLSGRFKFTQPIHWFLAKGQLTGLFKKILIVPFHGCNNYASCALSETATIWGLFNQTMNERYGDYYKFAHKFCVEPKSPNKYLKDVLSQQAFQFIADYNVERGIRQIAKFGQILDLQTSMTSIDKRNERPFVDSAFHRIKSELYYYEFGTTVYASHNDKTILLPLNMVNFKFEKAVHKTILINEAKFCLRKHLSSFPALLKKSFELLNDFEQVLFDPKKIVRFSTIISDMYIEISAALYYFVTLLPLQETGFHENVEPLAKLKIAMFEAEFEHVMFNKLLSNNKKVMYKGNMQRDVNFKKFFDVPEQFTSTSGEKQSKGKFECDNCNSKFASNVELENHQQAEKGGAFFTCEICRHQYSTISNLYNHYLKYFHILKSIAHNTPSNLNYLDDPVIGRYECPLESGKKRFVYTEKEVCKEHISNHPEYKANSNENQIIDRIGHKKTAGIFTCNLCGFKTDEQRAAENHLASVHFFHWPKLFDGNKVSKLELAKYVPKTFTIDGNREAWPRGIYECSIDNLKYNQKDHVQSHISHSFHELEYKEILETSKSQVEKSKLDIYNYAQQWTQNRKTAQKGPLLDKLITIKTNNKVQRFYWVDKKGKEIDTLKHAKSDSAYYHSTSFIFTKTVTHYENFKKTHLKEFNQIREEYNRSTKSKKTFDTLQNSDQRAFVANREAYKNYIKRFFILRSVYDLYYTSFTRN